MSAAVRRIARSAVAAVALAVGIGCGSEAEPPLPPAVAAEDDPVLEVTTARVRRGSILQRIAAPGSLMALRESRIGPEVSGRIERIFVSEGDRVEAGAPLFQIEREAEERVALARRDLETTLVRAPYAASVAARLEDEGTTALVRPQTIVLLLQETLELEAQATIPEVHFAAIEEGDAALLYVEGLAHPIPTEISRVSDAIDPATRTYLVKMRVANQDHRLKAGTFARVEILPRAKSDVILVPRDAVRREEGRTRVLLVREGRAVAQPVQLGIVSEDAVEVLRGVRVDDEVVVGASARRVAPGMRVEAVPLHRAGGGARPAAKPAPEPGA